ncbi:major facilitator superfamily transporter protein [Rutstroemia sp. NJR-2017a BVV2]|nr:major facilitator superfamily transporter protein [Rutstroemia sp. NJR-2017a BVV2]
MGFFSEKTRSFFARNSASNGTANTRDDEDTRDEGARPSKWSMGVLNDKLTHEVPGSVLLLTGKRNEPLGLRNAPARTSTSTLPPQNPAAYDRSRAPSYVSDKKMTKDGSTILEPQPEDSSNDPLNWPVWRRDCALLSLGLYCMLGGGMTPILAAGFTNVAATYHVTTAKVALTTGLYMMGMGVGSVVASPTAILFGKRPVYLAGAILFIITSVWGAVSPSYNSLLVARIFQGIAISPVECLPSATIAEIFFLHERAYRIGIYTLLLLGGKNLVPLVSAAIIQTLGWRWVFWIVAMVAGFCLVLLYFFVPETFWDRTPRPKTPRPGNSRKGSAFSAMFHHFRHSSSKVDVANQLDGIEAKDGPADQRQPQTRPTSAAPTRSLHVGFVPDDFSTDSDSTKKADSSDQTAITRPASPTSPTTRPTSPTTRVSQTDTGRHVRISVDQHSVRGHHEFEDKDESDHGVTHPAPALQTLNASAISDNLEAATPPRAPPRGVQYTHTLRQSPKLTFVQQLKVWNGRLCHDKWLVVAIRPFILFTYPAVLWSSIVYACSIGWLIVLSESVAVIYRTRDTYNFSALSTGLIYLSPFIGGVLGTAVAGKVSDVIVRAMSRRNGGLYEPEFRLIMGIPVAITTVIGLMGFGWSAHNHDAWIVPTVFFGIISFGCSLGSTTAITFCVDSYRQYAGEALVTLNFSKNIFHGLVFSLFFTEWLERSGSKSVFIWLGVIQLVCLTTTIPLYIFGKRARMWTVRKNWIERFSKWWK